ncbi:MAG: hypothetical protein KGK10_08655 [Rhodospirillales bacterium]|nr:hypothetical protein [Rhodospirillales bacterium]
MRTPFRAVAVAWARHSRVIATGLLSFALIAAAPKAAPWTMTLQQVGPHGTAVGTPVRLPCPHSGCDTTFPLVIARRTGDFHLQVMFVATGAYLTLVPRSPGIRAVMEFSTGYKGPIFIPLRRPDQNKQLLKLLVVGARDNGDPVLANGPVFHAKLRPDAYLRVAFTRPPQGH